MSADTTPYFQSFDANWWQGRVDSDDDAELRWHQIVKPFDFGGQPSEEGAACLLGFAVDEGVSRNQGRQGAKDGPMAFRRSMGSLPKYGDASLFDGGNILCPEKDLEGAQQALADHVHLILSKKALPVVIGGGHEVAWGHYQGIQQYLAQFSDKKRLGIINIDAHFDLRSPKDGSSPSSGTSFWHMWQEAKKRGQDFHYLVLGLQASGNTKALFQTAHEAKANYVLAQNLNEETVSQSIDQIAKKVDYIYLTLCMDVFTAAVAPGVSAPNPLGILPQQALYIIESVLATGKLLSFDMAELNPLFDIDHHTARLGAQLIFALLHKKAQSQC